MRHIDPHIRRRCTGRAEAIADLATAQHGVIARWQLLEVGVSPATIDRWVKGKRLHLVHHGVYALGHRALRARGAVMAAVLACGRHAVASHRTAAWLWGLLTDNRPVVDVTVPTHRRGRDRIRIHQARLQDPDRAVVDGIPVTSVARTLLDIAAGGDVERPIAEAERRSLFDLQAIEDVTERAHGHRGIGRLRAAIASHRSSPLARSELEHRFRQLIERSDLPLPSFNVTVHGYEVDALWQPQRVVVELDGYEFHCTRAAFERDRKRDAELTALGYRVLRFTWLQVPNALGTIRSTLTQA